MTQRKVIALGLDGFELTIADRLIESGKMPHLAQLREDGKNYLLDHGKARETGLAWEHFSAGQDPDSYGRWSAVDFDPSTYIARQSPAKEQSFLANTDQRIVAFDVPYLNLRSTRCVEGMSNWGAHDPGVACHANPPELVGEIDRKFGPYPGARYIYGLVWHSVDASEAMAQQMIKSMQKRTELTSWLLKTRFSDWQLAITVVAELHSVAEALWHGFDRSHQLHGHPSASHALRGIEGVYTETDRMIGRLQSEHPDADLVVFAMHGMGPNQADVVSMALLPEILFRRHFGRPFMHPREDWDLDCPLLQPGEDWSQAINSRLGILPPKAHQADPLGFIKSGLQKLGAKKKRAVEPEFLPWMPTSHYAPFWKDMDAFALPSFYDGQVRINLNGRESLGQVAPGDYSAVLDNIEEMLRGARDATTGEVLVADIERPLAQDPFDNTTTRCDLKIAWAQNTYAMDVPGLGRVGPVPQRRTGGHTGRHGYAVILSHDTELIDESVVSAFDIVPTLLDLAHIKRPDRVVGSSLVA